MSEHPVDENTNAREEAERRWPRGWSVEDGTYRDGAVSGFILGAEWRDSEPDALHSIAGLLVQHQPSQWRSFTTDEIVLRCCGEDFGPKTKKARKNGPTSYALWAAHVQEAATVLWVPVQEGN